MQNLDRGIRIVWANKSKRIAAEIIALDREHILNYIETMSSDLSAMAVEADQQFLGYLLNLASAEAKSGRGLAGNQRHGSVDRIVGELAEPQAPSAHNKSLA
jgi:hypothetical protein